MTLAKSFTVVFATHVFAYGCLLGETWQSPTVWCLMHVFSNLVVARYTVSSVLLTLSDPVQAVVVHSPGLDFFPVTLALVLHLYHALVFPMSRDDSVHHVVFALVMGVPSLLYANEAVNAMLFAVTGVPGAIIYMVVVLRRRMWPFLNERSISAFVNTSMRAPLVLCIDVAYLTGLYMSTTERHPPWWVVVLQVGLSATNAVVYTRQACVRAARR